MLNEITLQGRLTKDPELRYTQSNTAVASFSLAVERDFADKNTGKRQADFIDCVAWRGTGEFIHKYFHKGDMAILSGRLQIRDWTDQNNNKRRSAEVVVGNAYFCGSKKDGGQSTAPQAGAAPTAGQFTELPDDYDDGDLPF